jgi:hypothetical protein
MKDLSIEKLKTEFDVFYKEHNRYPTSGDINLYFDFSAKTVGRKYGGMKKLREVLGLEVIDYTTGNERSKKALDSYKISLVEQKKIYKKLLKIFNEYHIHRECPFGDSSRQRSDFKIFHKGGSFYVDVYYAENYANMGGCINAKLKKYDPNVIWGDIILINTNHKLDNLKDKIIQKKKNPLPKNVKLMTENEFIEYCKQLEKIV